jgi:hypothetical protein
LTEHGFYGQPKRQLTKTSYKNATIFVVLYSHLQFVYLMISNLTSSKKLDAKCAFECFATKNSVKIMHYNCNNGCFANSVFVCACEESRQTPTFCGVNAHFQNGIADRAIRDLWEISQKQLLHARQCWPQAVSLALWPYALQQYTAHLNNVLPTLKEG